ncbi:hypothetical protein T08_1176 [Trichinella sp. T8]|nr:hypothetical protein T08_1176 [Trichinella sp. T8]
MMQSRRHFFPIRLQPRASLPEQFRLFVGNVVQLGQHRHFDQNAHETVPDQRHFDRHLNMRLLRDDNLLDVLVVADHQLPSVVVVVHVLLGNIRAVPFERFGSAARDQHLADGTVGQYPRLFGAQGSAPEFVALFAAVGGQIFSCHFSDRLAARHPDHALFWNRTTLGDGKRHRRQFDRNVLLLRDQHIDVRAKERPSLAQVRLLVQWGFVQSGPVHLPESAHRHAVAPVAQGSFPSEADELGRHTPIPARLRPKHTDADRAAGRVLDRRTAPGSAVGRHGNFQRFSNKNLPKIRRLHGPALTDEQRGHFCHLHVHVGRVPASLLRHFHTILSHKLPLRANLTHRSSRCCCCSLSPLEHHPTQAQQNQRPSPLPFTHRTVLYKYLFWLCQ